jgi:hypothetical protein
MDDYIHEAEIIIREYLDGTRYWPKKTTYGADYMLPE